MEERIGWVTGRSSRSVSSGRPVRFRRSGAGDPPSKSGREPPASLKNGEPFWLVDQEAQADGVGRVLGVEGGGTQDQLLGGGVRLVLAAELRDQLLDQLPGEAAVDPADRMDFQVRGRPGDGSSLAVAEVGRPCPGNRGR